MPSRPEVKIQRLDESLGLPSYQKPGDAGLDLQSASEVHVPPGERAVVGTGIAVAIPEGWCGLVTPRSGRAADEGLSIVNSPGVIDSGYRGEVKVVLVNLDPRHTIRISRGERIAQMLLVPVATVTLEEVSELPVSARGEDGYGSTGKS